MSEPDYDNGGLLLPAVTVVVNDTGRPERMLTAAEELDPEE